MTPRAHNVTSCAGALVVLPVVVALRNTTQGPALTWQVALPVVLWVAHFARRALEALWLHRYSKPSFPWGDALIEYVYYWGFGAWIGWTLGAPASAPFANPTRRALIPFVF